MLCGVVIRLCFDQQFPKTEEPEEGRHGNCPKADASWALPSLSGASIRRSTAVVIGRRILGCFPPRPYTSECHQVLSLTPVLTNVWMGEADRGIFTYSEPLRGSILSFVGRACHWRVRSRNSTSIFRLQGMGRICRTEHKISS